jgi:hypothetical protein
MKVVIFSTAESVGWDWCGGLVEHNSRGKEGE